MKKVLLILLALVLVISMVGCSDPAKDPVNNSLFTDEFFDGVVRIRFSACEPVSGEQMAPVIRYLKGLTLVETEDRVKTTDDNGEVLLGGAFMVTFDKADGTEIHFLMNTKVMNCISGLDANYAIESGHLFGDLKAAFGANTQA